MDLNSLAMPSGTPMPPDWKVPYELALAESEPARVLVRIATANQAILARIDDLLTDPATPEHRELNDALTSLRILRLDYERQIRARRDLKDVG